MTPIFHGFFIFCMAWAAWSDLRRFRIFNVNILMLIFAFAAVFALGGEFLSLAGFKNFGWHVAAGLAMFGVFLVPYLMNQMGEGDVKLIAAIALWFGWHPITLTYALYATLAGGVLTIALMLFRKVPLPAPLTRFPSARRLHVRKNHFPYGVSLGLTAIVLSFQAPIFS